MENEDELVMYLRMLLLMFGHSPMTHDEMISFDKAYIGQDQKPTPMARSIPDQAFRRELISYDENEGVISWRISKRGYALLEKHNRLK